MRLLCPNPSRRPPWPLPRELCPAWGCRTVSAPTLLPRAPRLLRPSCPARRSAPCPAQRCRATAAWLHRPRPWGWHHAGCVPSRCFSALEGFPRHLPARLAPPAVTCPAAPVAMTELVVPSRVVAARPCEGLPPHCSPPVLSACPSCGQRGSSGSRTARQPHSAALSATQAPQGDTSPGHQLLSAGICPPLPCWQDRGCTSPAKTNTGVRAASLPTAAPSWCGSNFPSWRLRVPGPPCKGGVWWQKAMQANRQLPLGKAGQGWCIRQPYRRGAGSVQRQCGGALGWDGGVEGEPKRSCASQLCGRMRCWAWAASCLPLPHALCPAGMGSSAPAVPGAPPGPCGL